MPFHEVDADSAAVPTPSVNDVPAVVCTLGEKPLGARALEWADVTGLSTEVETFDNGGRARFPVVYASEINDFVSREIGCCGSWLSMSLESTEGFVDLNVTTTNPHGVEVIHTMLGVDR